MAAAGAKDVVVPEGKTPAGPVQAGLYCTVEAGTTEDAAELPQHVRGGLMEILQKEYKDKE